MAIAKNHFYHAHTRRLMSAFAQLFTGMDIARYDENGNIIELIKNIPVENELIDKAYARSKVQEVDDGNLASKGHITLPRMSFQLSGMSYNSSRKLARMQRIVKRGADGDLRVTPVQTPYDFNFTLKIMATNFSDAIQIHEQIAYAFTPSVTMTLRDVPFADEHVDVPVFLTSQTIEDNADDPLENSRRLVLITLTFTAQYYLFGPAGTDKEIIAARLRTGDPAATVDPIKPAIEKFVIDIYGAESEFYSGNESGVRYTVTDINKDGVGELKFEAPPPESEL